MRGKMERRQFLARMAQTAAGAVMLPKILSAQTNSATVQHAAAKKRAPAVKTTSVPALKAPMVMLNVREAPFNAKGDGTTKETAAFQAALDRCGVLGGGEVLVPAGNYLIGSIQLRSKTTLRFAEGAVLTGSPVMDEYAVTQVRWEGRWIAGHIALVYAIDAHDVSVVGPGKILGNETLGGRPNPANPLRHPALIEFIRCDNVHLSGFSTHYARVWSIHPTNCTNVKIEGLTIRSTTGNGDGIDVDSCKHVHISKCDIATGDDCISLKSGRGLEGYMLQQVTEDVTIEDCTMSDNIFACIGIGSETSGGIRKVRIRNCKFTGAKTFALYIKSRPGRGAFIEDIVAENLNVTGTYGGGFLRFNLLASGLMGEDPVPGLEGIPQGGQFVFRNVHIDEVPVLVDGGGVPAEKPLQGLVLENISGKCKKGITLENARGVVIRNLHVTGYEGPLLSTLNVTGVGLTGAVKAEPMKAPEPVPARAEAYKLQ